MDFINKLKPEFVISLHINSAKDAAIQGTEIFIGNEDMAKKQKSENLALELNSVFDNQNTRIKNKKLFILENADCPLVVLEMGNLDNENDRAFLTSEEGQTAFANKILNVIK